METGLAPLVLALLVSAAPTTVPAPPPQALLPTLASPARTAPQGEVDLRAGVNWMNDTVPAPLLGGPEGDLLQFPALQALFPLGAHADLEISCAGFQQFRPDEGDHTTEVGDPHLWTRIVFRDSAEKSPGIGLRFGIKVPSASDDTHLGTDEADVFGSLLLSQPLGRSFLHLNVGVAILGDPLATRSQKDLLSYALALESPVGDKLRLFVEAAGLYSTSDGSRGEEGEARLGLSWATRRGAWEAVALAGYEPDSPDWGLSVSRLFRLGS
jgi:hypothetical protein